MRESAMLEAALAYAREGFRVLPVSPGNSHGRGAKLPLTQHGVKDASADESTVVTWWRRHPNACIAVACGGGFAIVDLDRHDGQADGVAAMAALQAEGFALPADAPRVATAGGGEHIWLRAAFPKSRKLAPGIDLLGEGRYALVPPSVLDDGRRYRFLESGEASNG